MKRLPLARKLEHPTGRPVVMVHPTRIGGCAHIVVPLSWVEWRRARIERAALVDGARQVSRRVVRGGSDG